MIVLKSTNGGETWFSLNESSDCSFIDFSWVSEELLFSKCNGYLIKSIDGGHTWTEVSPSIVENLQFMNNDVGYGINGLNLYRTVNGGETWEFIKFLPDIHFIVDNSQFMNHVVGYGTYDYLNLFRSENGGESLEQNNFFSGISLRFIDENTGFYYESGLWKTIDSGSNFEFIGGEFGEGFSFFYVENENRTWGILHPLLDGDGSSRGVVKSEILDDGTYAEEVYLEYDPNTHMFSIHFAEENTGYIVGYSHGNPTIWKNSTGINTMSTAEQVETAKIKVYPNPASDILNIDLGKTFTEIKVSLSDVSGKQFISETHKQKDKLSIHTQTLPKGVYVLSIQTNQHNFNKKIIIN